MQKKTINVEIGNRIRVARENAKLTQERFAELIGMGAKNVSSIERGAVGISVTSLQRICQVLSISADDLLFGKVEGNDVQTLTARLKRLTPEQFQIANDILNKLLEAFALQE